MALPDSRGELVRGTPAIECETPNRFLEAEKLP